MTTARWLRSTLGDQRGSIFLISLVLVFVMTLLGIALFDLSLVDNRLVLASENDAQAFYTAEAGLYRAQLDLTDGAGTTFDTVFAGGVIATLYNGQSFTQGGAGTNYTVTVKPVVGSSPQQVTLISTGCAWGTSPCPASRAQKTVQAQMKVGSTLPGFVGLESVSLGSTSGLVDSFDSTQGVYNPLTAGKLAKSLSNGTISMKNLTVKGSALSAASSISIVNALVDGNITAGTTVSNGGTVSGTITQNNPTPPMVAPPVPDCGPPYSPATGISGLYNYNPAVGDFKVSGAVATFAAGTYCFRSVTLVGGATLAISGPVVLSVTQQVSATGGAFANTTYNAANLQIISSYTQRNGVSVGGSSTTYLTIYAPTTDVSVSGGAPLYGALVGKTLSTGGSASIHYDVNLANRTDFAGGIRKFVLISWIECKNPSCS